MDISIKDIDKSKKEIRVALSFKEFDRFIQKTISVLKKELEIKGFRKGQAPKEMVVKELGQARILNEAAGRTAKEIYLETVKKNNLEVLGMPEIEILKLAYNNPFEFRAIISVLPKIILPDYKKLVSKIKKPDTAISEQEVDQAFEQLQKIKDKIPEEQKEKINFDKPAEIKEILRQEVGRHKEIAEKSRVRNEILKEISENCELMVPEALITIEKQRAIEELKRNVPQMLKITFDDYLKKLQKSQEQLEESLVPDISERIKRILILKEIQQQEEIAISEKELEIEVQRFLENLPPGKQRENIDQEGLRSYLKERMEQEKTLQFLEELIQ